MVVQVPSRGAPPDLPFTMAGAKFVTLDRTLNIHSCHVPERNWQPGLLTGGYWDFAAALPMLAREEGAHVGILGLGCGTASELMLHFQPSCKVVGWELDEELVRVGIEHMGLGDQSVDVRVADAVEGLEACPDGAFDCLFVDLFQGGQLAPPLLQQCFWELCARKAKYTLANLAFPNEDVTRGMRRAFPCLYENRSQWKGRMECNLALASADGDRINLDLWGRRLPNLLSPFASGWRQHPL